MKSRDAIVVLVLGLTACGGGNKATYDNEKLSADVTKKLHASATLVCTTKDGYLRGYFSHSYNRVCGPRHGQPSVFVSLSEKREMWCAVAPRVAQPCPR